MSRVVLPKKSRRSFLKMAAGASIALPFYQLLQSQEALAADGKAKRFIVFYFPDGIPGASEQGDASLWHAQGSEYDFQLPGLLDPLKAFKEDCLFFNGLSMGATDAGSHPGGAKKLLTAVDHGGGESIDHYLAHSVGASAPWRHLYLGVQATQNGASGDKHISYASAGVSIQPEDDPTRAFDRIFAGRGQVGSGGGTTTPAPTAPSKRQSVIDGVYEDMKELRARLGDTDKVKLDRHLESLREVEARLDPMRPQMQDPAQMASCDEPKLNSDGFDVARTFEPDLFPVQMRMQIDLIVQAMACGLTQVATLQSSVHTSELIMSRFPGTDLYDPNYDMRSHQASHYGPRHDFNHREFKEFYNQRHWFLQQFAYLLQELKSRPEGDGNMLDNSVILCCTEVSDGNTHSHDNMPFLLAGKAGGAIRTGRLLQYGYKRHSELHVAIARAMGADIWNFGWDSNGPLDGVLG